MDNSAKPETKVFDNTGKVRICPFITETKFSGNVPVQNPIRCIQYECMAWQCLGDFKEHIEGELRTVRKWGCKLIERGDL